MASRLCGICHLAWPSPIGDPARYRVCPRCEAITKHIVGDPDISEASAIKLAGSWDFFNRYERREQERRNSGEPSPEEIGIKEARMMIDLDRDLAA